MNIFLLSKNPVLAARMQCDKHVVKMILETAQLLCSPFVPGKAPYKRSHYNHPSAQWTRASKKNYQWLIKHGLALCAEYQYRYNKEHKSKQVILWCQNNYKRLKLPSRGLLPMPQVMPEKYRGTNPVSAYRKYYKNEKRQIARWTRRELPKWWF